MDKRVVCHVLGATVRSPRLRRVGHRIDKYFAIVTINGQRDLVHIRTGMRACYTTRTARQIIQLARRATAQFGEMLDMRDPYALKTALRQAGSVEWAKAQWRDILAQHKLRPMRRRG